MRTKSYIAVVLVVLLSTLSAASCAKAPPNLTPQATVAFKGTQAVKALDILRDTAVSANAQNPPLLSEDITRKVVLYHQATVKTIQSSTAGWQSAALTGLTALLDSVPPAQRAVLEPYTVLIRTVIQEVTR